MNRLAAVARKHGCPEVAKQIIATQYGFNAMEVQEAFVKITKQAKASLEQPRLYMEGVNLLSSQNLDYFTNTHQVLSLTAALMLLHMLHRLYASGSEHSHRKSCEEPCKSLGPVPTGLEIALLMLMGGRMLSQAEIFRLHGQLLAAVEERDAANKAFATSLALWPQLAEGWLSWGTFCDKQVGTSHSCLTPLCLQADCPLLYDTSMG